MATGRNIKVAIIILQISLSSLSYGDLVKSNLEKAFKEQVLSDPDKSSAGVANEGLWGANSREALSNDAFERGKSGEELAGAMGGALLGTGSALLIQGIIEMNPIKQAAGSTLMSMGNLELIQAGYNKEGKKLNDNQTAQLNNQMFSTPAGAEVAGALNNPDLDKALNKAGVDADEFKSKLAAGEFKTGADIMRALGKEVDSETAANAKTLVDQELNKAFGEVQSQMGGVPADTITASDENKRGASENSSGGFSNGSSNSESRELASIESSSNSPSNLAGRSNNVLNKNELAQMKADHEKGSSNGFQDMLNKMFGANNASMVEKNTLLQNLTGMGIQLPVKGVSIFDLARRKYRKFGESQKKVRRVALWSVH